MVISTIIILTVWVVNLLPPLVGLWLTPATGTFLGTIHHPFDYFYYLSQFAQGKDSWFWSYDLFTSDFLQTTLVGWVNVLLGKLFFLVGLSHFWAYQLSVACFSLLFLIACYQLIRQTFNAKTDAHKVNLALFLFAIFNVFPRLTWGGAKPTVSFFDFWNNYANPGVRLGGVPHHLIISLSILSCLLLASLWLTNPPVSKLKALFKLTLLAAAGFVLASLHPVQWFLTSISIFLAWPISYGLGKHHRFRRMTAGLIPATVIFAAGVPVAAYLQSLFRLLPYSQLTGWEATQQVRLSLIGWVGALGPVTLLGLAGLWLWRSKLTLLKLILIIYTIVSLIGLVTPMSVKLGLTNVRFASAATILILAMAAAEFITYISAKLSNRRWALALILLGLTLMTAPGHWRQFLTRLKFDPQNAYYYLPQESLSVLEFAQKNSGSHNTFLVIWPYNVSFSGITGRRQYNGHPLLTIASASKDKTAYEFFAGNLSQREMQALLAQERITYLLAYPWTFNPLPEFLQMIAVSSALSLYRVTY